MPTNVVFIMTDNQGAWSLGCYGNPDIRTPNIDRLASEGMRFSQAYCVNSVCSPSRATYFTGLIPSQHGVHCYLGGEKPDAQMGPGAYSTVAEFDTLSGTLSEAGYKCGLSGKWHLGDSLKPQEGFTYWFNRPKGHTSMFYDDELIWDGEVYTEPRYTTEVITEHALDFLANARQDPFFLYVAYNGPYGLGQSMTSVHKNRHTDFYAGKELASFPREDVHPWLVHNRQIINNQVSIEGYASAVSGVDDGVGDIMDALDEYGLAEDTLVIYASDQGLCGGHHGMWGMGDHSRPLHTFEEAIHIPLIFRHPGGVPSGVVADCRTCNYDFMPSLLNYLGLDAQVPDRSPGRNYGSVLRGESVDWQGTIYHEFEDTRMVRTDRWKYTWRYPNGPDELYDMENDSGERHNLVDNLDVEEVVSNLRGKIDAFFNRYADPEFDLWKGGRSKAGRAVEF
ncbi:MAG: sulfatase-like hydrolase/transferase [Candidatus Latescibacteria bacterium]|jgi:arylsulfatase A-like enzyme|nr:sulfatase-like hydrolase/transferase [Candidatus Latescibacterota bacterium]